MVNMTEPRINTNEAGKKDFNLPAPQPPNEPAGFLSADELLQRLAARCPMFPGCWNQCSSLKSRCNDHTSHPIVSRQCSESHPRWSQVPQENRTHGSTRKFHG
jgi:hypothetical protein